ncbi:LOW QUALITY PROTEIN: hypothetical protein U9M48_030255 [Paspalum notatum var. saurae]|uniref:Reverse transcriptase Ty1/copia-type domain-containing protein n=1 Tax=Paspalum notatum var. saurae TaxID=547442 RepID=A0AAQ3U4K0_PASNO
MAEEIAALERTGTLDRVLLPSSATPIMCKWVYKIKTHSDGSIECYKARLVARGFQQEYGRDYEETFAPVAHRTTIHTLVAVSSVHRWAISQLDVKNAFLHGKLQEEVYMHPPPSYLVPNGHLRHSLYGLKQAPHALFERFSSVVTAARFVTSQHDPTLFVHTSPRGHSLFLLYVDDMRIIGDDLDYLAFVKARLNEQFHMSDLGSLTYFLGIEVISTPNGYYLSQQKYIRDILDRAGLTDQRPMDTPMELHLCLCATDGVPLEDSTRYRHLVSSLVYLGITRPHISYVVHILSQFIVEAELRALAAVTAEVTWLRWLLADFGVALSSSTPLHYHSTSAISIPHDLVKHQLTKHIGIDRFYIRPVPACLPRRPSLPLRPPPSSPMLPSYSTSSPMPPSSPLAAFAPNAFPLAYLLPLAIPGAHPPSPCKDPLWTSSSSGRRGTWRRAPSCSSSTVANPSLPRMASCHGGRISAKEPASAQDPVPPASTKASRLTRHGHRPPPPSWYGQIWAGASHGERILTRHADLSVPALSLVSSSMHAAAGLVLLGVL